MKSIYKITDKKGATLCFQVAANGPKAIETAKMYGHRRAHEAEYCQPQS